MSGSEWLVIVAGVAAIVWVNWYFFVAGRAPAFAAAAVGGSGPLEQTITVDGGYSPAVVRVKAGQPGGSSSIVGTAEAAPRRSSSRTSASGGSCRPARRR